MDFFIFTVYAIALLASFVIVWMLLRDVLTLPDTKTESQLDDLNEKKSVNKKSVGKRLRILMFGWEFPPFNSGGLGVACLGLTRALADENLDIVFVMPKKLPISVPFAKMVSAEIDNPNISIEIIDSPIKPYANGGSYMVDSDGNPIYGSDLISETKRYARFGAVIAAREQHDIIYAHDWLSFGAGKEAKKVSGKPFIAHVHATEFDRSGGNVNQDVYEIEHTGLHCADKIITVSNKTKDIVIKKYGVPHKKISVVWNGIDDLTAPVKIDSIPPRLLALKKAGYKIVLFMARLTLQKGPDYFVRAAHLVAQKDPNVIFILAGSGDMERQVMHQAASMGLADRMFFPGFLRGHDTHEAYSFADLYVMPSVSEPFGIAVLEAMRAKTPVIVSKQSGVTEAVKSVLSVDFWDVEKMAELILSVVSSAELSAELSAKGVIDAASLTWDRAAHEVRGVIDELMYETKPNII